MSKKPVPSQKKSVSRSRTRTNKKRSEIVKRLLNLVALNTSENGEKKLSHFASPKGFYKNLQLKKFQRKTESKSQKKIQEIKA